MTTRIWITMGACALIACTSFSNATGPKTSATGPLAGGDGWRTDRVWYDGLAEKCTYKATRTIYGKERVYTAIAYTNKENVDASTTCKSATNEGVEVFKHHWSEIIPTEKYDYRFSTMSYTRVADMRAWKLTVGTQEDCGASFKEIWRAGEKLAWFESTYFPDGGRREGTIPESDAVFFDALTLALRDFDFVGKKDVMLAVVPTQKDTHSVPFGVLKRRAHFVETSEIELPIGKMKAHEVVLVDDKGVVDSHYWFAADGKAPLLHALVRYEGPSGVSYLLQSHERTAYWKRD
jgi:hypothetical protein